MSRITVKRVDPKENIEFYYACVIYFPNGNSTKIVDWEFKAVKQSGRIFIFVMLLYYVGHYKQSGLSDYHKLVQSINKL